MINAKVPDNDTINHWLWAAQANDHYVVLKAGNSVPAEWVGRLKEIQDWLLPYLPANVSIDTIRITRFQQVSDLPWLAQMSVAAFKPHDDSIDESPDNYVATQTIDFSLTLRMH